MRGCSALAFYAALELGLLVAVQSCGHHVVHNQIKDLVARHTAQQSHMASAARGFQTASQGWKGSHDKGENSGFRLREDEPDEHGHSHLHGGSHHHDHDHDHMHEHGEVGIFLSSFEGGEAAAVARQRRGEDDGARDDDAWMTATSAEDHEEEEYDDGDDESGEEEAPRRRSMQQTSTPAAAPIRLSVTYQMLGALDASQQQTLTRVVEAVRRILRKFISVKRPSSGGMLVDPYCNLNSWACYPDFNSLSRSPDRECGLATILREHIVNPFNCTSTSSRAQREALGKGASGPASGAGGGASGYGTGCGSYGGTKGEDTDMYMYITAVQNDDCEAGAAAWARPCLLDLGNNRPLLGAANVCPRALGLLDEDALTAVLTHEIIHALGFTDSMYNMTRRSDGTLRPLSELVATSQVGGKQVQLLVSPNVREAARTQFGCPSLVGAQLEEEGSAGSAGSHWEYTHYQGEVMVASTVFAADGTPPALSNLTLAYLDDTGWYSTNRSAAGLLSWGAGSGCALPTSTCADYMANVPDQRLFCNATAAAQRGSSSAFACSSDYKANGVCRAVNFTGGCGLVLSRDAKQTCLGPNAPNDRPEVFGWGMGSPSGRCLPVVYLFTARVGSYVYSYPASGRNGDADAACFDTVCSANGSKVSVRLLGQEFDCPAGGYLNLPQLLRSRYDTGRIGPCPSAQDLCATQSCPATACNPTGGVCRDGTCYCRLSYTGRDCSFNLITGQPISDTSSQLTGSTGDGAASSPPPPMKVWTQVVQLTLALNNTPAFINSQLPQLRAAIATWAGLNLSAVIITNVGAGSGAAGGGAAAGDSYDATAATRRRRRGLQQAAAAASPPPPAAAAVATATAWLTPSNARPAALLLSWLKNNVTQRIRLMSRLASAGFIVIQDGISSESIITQSMGSSPPPSASLTAASAPSDSHSTRGRTVIIIALAVGGVAAAGIISTIIAVFVIRARRNRRRGPAVGRAQLYQLPPAAGGGNGIGSGGGAAPQPPAPYGAAAGGPSSNPFAAGGAGTWHGGSYPANPEAAAQSYYSARAASMAPQQQQQHPPQQSYQYAYQPGGAGPPMAPLYSGPTHRTYT